MSFIESVDSESVDDVVANSEITLETGDEELLSNTLIVPVAVHCISRGRVVKDTIVFSFHDPSFEEETKGFLKNKLGSKFYFFSLGDPLNTDLSSYLGVYFSNAIKNIVFIRNRPIDHQISKDVEYRYFLKSVMESSIKFSIDWLFDVKFSTIFTQEYNESLCILNEERHTFSYPKFVKVNVAKG
jgi:hypothetical protein